MKYIFTIFIFTLFFSGCQNKDLTELTKEECLQKGHKWNKKMTMNWLTGVEEDRGVCKKK